MLLFLIIGIRKAQRLRFLALYFLYERRHRHITHALLVTKINWLQHRQRKASARRRRVVWSYPRPQGWFEEMYRNPGMSTLWKNHFRVSKDTFDYICQLVGPELSRQNTRLRRAIPLAKRVGMALWRLGTGNSYRTTGITFGQGKSTVIKTRENFMEAFIRRKNEFIRFPEDTRDVAHAMRKMESVAGLPNVVGATDGPHISIKAPHVNHEDYFNRKQNYSVNFQGVVDADGKFIDVSTGWPSSIHDTRVLRLSTLYRRAENDLILNEPVRHINRVTVRPLLIGDSAYPLLTWLVGPYPQSRNLSREHCKFNKILNKTRVIVERAYGKLKSRWRCLLKALEENTGKVPFTVITCCILHNICILLGDDLDDSDLSSDDDDDDKNDDGDNGLAVFGQGRRIRQALTEQRKDLH